MATGGRPPHPAGEERRESLNCSLCLEVFTSPKLLPCHHSFCLTCLEDLTSRGGTASFPCPQCRHHVVIPTGGVAAFQTNLSLRSEDLERARNKTLCMTHPDQNLDLYCADCQLAVCLKCVLTKHKQHSTKNLSEAASEAKSLLKQSQVRLQKAVSYMTDEVTAESKQSVTKFFGSIQKVRMEAVAPEVMGKKMFSCGDGDDTEVFSLCPKDDDTVWVSFARRKAKGDAPCETFDMKGTCIWRIWRKQSYTSRGGSTGIWTTMKKRELMQTFDKSQKRTIFKLSKITAKEAIIETINKTVEVTSERSFLTEENLICTIRVGTQRAFDVDSSEQLFVVVQEAQSPGGQRKVLLYRRGQHTPVSTYTPPTAACQPSDVCFYRLGGREVLLVADEGTDSVHVLDVQGDELKFDRYLAPGCPLLVQPTALNTDTQGRLWVACRGGTILTFTPIA